MILYSLFDETCFNFTLLIDMKNITQAMKRLKNEGCFKLREFFQD